jgi:subtilase family protein
LNVGPVPYWVIDTTHAAFVVNDLVSKIGSATGWSQGTVSRTCVDVSPSSGVTYRCQMFATYGADDGDSGAPILLDIQGGADSTVTLGGIHSGRAGSNRVFSPWSGIVQDYGSLSVLSPPSGPPFPATAPDSVPTGYYAAANLVRNDARFSFAFFRDVVAVLFSPTTSVAERQAAVDSIGGTVVGGVRLDGVDGFYLIALPPDNQNDRVIDAAERLNEMLAVRVAMPDFVLENPAAYRRPNDGTGWTRADWTLVPDSAYNSLTPNWALEAIAAPLAWGCTTGDVQTRIAVLDMGLHDVPDLHDNIAASTGVVTVAVDPFDHGTSVSGLIGAVGDNQAGVTGVMWRAGVQLWDVALRNPNGTPVLTPNGDHLVDIPLLMRNVTGAAISGARVINMSLGVAHGGPVVNTAAFAQAVAWFDSAFMAALAAAPGHTPLIVVAAGNNGHIPAAADPYWALMPTIKNALPNRTLVVAAGGRTRNSLAPFSSDGPLVDVAAPGDSVTVLRPAGVARDSGTSFSAPLVTGLAGLLFTFDSTLTAAQVRQFIVDGAGRSGMTAGTRPLINAYESLKLAAQRPGAPLCGNRAWVNNNAVIVERDTTMHTSEQIISLGAPASFVHARHGGHRIEVSTDTSTRAFELRQGQWIETPDTAQTPYSGTLLSMVAFSHDADTLATARYWTSSASDSGLFEHTIRTFNPSTARVLDTLALPLSRFTGAECVLRASDGTCNSQMATTGAEEQVQAQLVYAPTGNRLFVAVAYLVTRLVGITGWQACPLPPPGPQGEPDPTTCRSTTWQEVSERTDLWAIDLQSGLETQPWHFPGRVYWFGISEDGRQVVSGEGLRTTVWTWQPRADGSGFEQVWSNPGTVTGCAVRYRSLATGAEVAPQIAAANACTLGGRGEGTIAPAPKRDLSTP